MLMAAKRSKSKPALEFQDGGRLFSETVVISRPWIEVCGRNLGADSFGPSDMRELAKPETGSKFVTPLPPSCKINMTS